MNIFILTLAMMSSTINPSPATTQAQSVDSAISIPACIAPPEWATKEQIECHTDACDVFTTAWNACTTSSCRALARLEHLNAVNACLSTNALEQTFMAAQSDRESDPWMTIWISNDGAGYAFGYDEPAGELVLRF